MWKVGLALAAGIMAFLFAGQAQAAPCVTVVSGGAVPVANLISGTCVNAGDETFSNFTDKGFPNTGSATWSFSSASPNVVLGFQGVLGPSASGTLSYAVAINPAVTTTMKINGVEKDFTLNAVDHGFATGTLTGNVATTTPRVSITCTRTVNPVTSTCPETANFAPVSSITLNESLTLGPNSVATGLTETTFLQAIPEPASLVLLGGALVGLGVIRRRHP